MRELPKAHEIWRHFKKNTYEIITIAEHTETGEKLARYDEDLCPPVEGFHERSR